MVRVLAKILGGRKYRAFSLDFAHAYKHVGAAADQRDFATIILRDPAGVPHMATLRTQHIGSRRPPGNWDRAAAFLHFSTYRLFDVWLGVFAGDCFFAQNRMVRWLLRCPSLKASFELLWLTLAENKEHPPRRATELLGAHITTQKYSVTASISARRRNDYTALLWNVLNRGAMSPVDAAKIQGKLGPPNR